jgi:hypothetical protein
MATLFDQLLDEWTVAADQHRSLGNYGAGAGPLQSCLDGLVMIATFANLKPGAPVVSDREIRDAAQSAALEFGAVADFAVQHYFDDTDDQCIELSCKFRGNPMIGYDKWQQFVTAMRRMLVMKGDNRFIKIIRA